MGRSKTTRKFAEVKRMINPKDARLKPNQQKKEEKKPENSSGIFTVFPLQLCPYSAIPDLNKSMMDCLYAKCVVNITDCVLGEIEKLGSVYKVALKIARDPKFTRLKCLHSGTYADDCIHRCYIVATCDKGLKKRIRAIPGVPILSIQSRKYSIERLPEVEAL